MRLIRDGARAMAASASWTAPGGSSVALVTPFRAGRVDSGAFAALCDRQIRRGTAALIVGGSTGEGSALSATEHARIVANAVEAAMGRVPIVAGCGAPSTDAARALAVAAARSGASALLCAPPPYSKPTQAGIVAHIRAVAHAADLPVILYDVPGRTGVAIADETVAELFGSGSIVGLKDAAGDLSRPARLRGLCGERLVQLTGDDGTTPGYLAMGGHGCISVTANVVPALCAQMHKAWAAGNLVAFGRLRDLLAPLHDALFAESNPIPVKAALFLAGLCEGEPRLPLTRASDGTVERLAAILPALLAADDEATGQPLLSLVM